MFQNSPADAENQTPQNTETYYKDQYTVEKAALDQMQTPPKSYALLMAYLELLLPLIRY